MANHRPNIEQIKSFQVKDSIEARALASRRSNILAEATQTRSINLYASDLADVAKLGLNLSALLRTQLRLYLKEKEAYELFSAAVVLCLKTAPLVRARLPDGRIICFASYTLLETHPFGLIHLVATDEAGANLELFVHFSFVHLILE